MTAKDELYDEAVVLVRREQKASTSFIQRHLQIGYNRAAQIIETMQAEGIVGAPNHVGKREVLEMAPKPGEPGYEEHLQRAAAITEKIVDIAAATGTTPKQVFDTAKGILDRKNEASNQTDDVGGVSGQRLKAFIERVERLEEEKAALAEDIKDIFAEAKGTGFDVKIMRKVIRLRKMDKEKRAEEEQLEELYKAAIGMD